MAFPNLVRQLRPNDTDYPVEVWQGTWGPDAVPVSVKLARLTQAADAERAVVTTATSLQKAGSDLQRLQHPYIPGHIASGSEDGITFLAVAFVETRAVDGSLAKLKGAQPLDRSLRIVWQIAEALDASHQLGLYHGGLTPGKVMLSTHPHDGAFDRVHVRDFAVGRLRQQWECAVGRTSIEDVERAHFMAPEQTDLTFPATAASDVYTLGVLFYVLLTGVCPFGGAIANDVILAKLDDAPVGSVATFRPTENAGAVAAIDRVLSKMLTRDPARRASCFPPAGLGRAVKDLAQSLGVEVEPRLPLPPAPVPKPVAAPRQSRVVLVSLAAIAIVLATLLAVVTMSWRTARAAFVEEEKQHALALRASLTKEAVRSAFRASTDGLRLDRDRLKLRLADMEKALKDADVKRVADLKALYKEWESAKIELTLERTPNFKGPGGHVTGTVAAGIDSSKGYEQRGLSPLAAEAVKLIGELGNPHATVKLVGKPKAIP